MKKKKLIDVLQEIEPDKIVHVGASTGFFYVGAAKDAINEIDGISNQYLSEIKSRREHHISKLEKEIMEIPLKEKSLYDWLKKVDHWITRVQKKRCLVENDNKDIKDFKSFRNRNVVEMYERVQKDGVVIIVSGIERGEFWDLEEFKKAHD